MLRVVLLASLALAGCSPPPAPPIQMASAPTTSDPALLQAFFGTGDRRAISPVIRCGVRCAAR